LALNVHDTNYSGNGAFVDAAHGIQCLVVFCYGDVRGFAVNNQGLNACFNEVFTSNLERRTVSG